MPDEKIVAIALLTQGDLKRLGGTLAKVWPVHNAPEFEELLQAIDDAERHVSKQGKS